MKKLLVLGAAIAAGAMVQAEPVTLETGDAVGESSFTNGEHWSDKSIPSAGKGYLVALGDEAPLRTVDDKNVVTTDVWPGDSLQIGVVGGESGRLDIMAWGDGTGQSRGLAQQYRVFRFDNLILANGTLSFSKSAGSGGYQRLLGAATVTAPEQFEVSVGAGTKILGANLSGASGTKVVFTNPDGNEVENHRIFLSGDNSNYFGQFVFDRVCCQMSASFSAANRGAEGAKPQPDALVFRNGAVLRGDYTWTVQPGNFTDTVQIQAGNRGLWFEDDASGFHVYNGATVICSADISGEAFRVTGDWNQYVTRNERMSRLVLNGKVDVSSVKFANGTSWGGTFADLPRLVIGPDARLPESPLEVRGLAGGTLGAKGCSATLLRKLTGTDSYFESDCDDDKTTLGHFTLAEGSTLGAGKVYVRVDNFPTMAKAAEFPVLSIPTSVRTELEKEDVVLKTLAWGDSPLDYEVRTADGFHTVYVKFTEGLATQRFVVPATSVDPETYVDDGAYHTRATAATNLAQAIRVAAVGDTIFVAKGVHDITKTIVLEKDVTLVGLDFDAMRADKGAILDGGYPARTNRIMKLQKAKLNYLTFRHGASDGTDYYKNHAPCGGAICLGDNTFRIKDCDFIENFATGSGGALASHAVNSQIFCTRCRFIGNSANGAGGAAQHQYDGATPWFGYRDCIFSNNTAKSTPTVINSSGRGLALIGCTFVESRGPAIMPGSGEFRNCLFDGAEAGQADGHQAFKIGSDGCTMSDVTIRNYTTSGQPLFGIGKGTVERLVATNNVCSNLIHWYADGDPKAHTTYRHCLFADNTVKSQFLLNGHTFSDFENCTVANNHMSANNAYFTRISSYYCRVTVTNCIFWANGTTKSLVNFNDGINSLSVGSSVFDVAAPEGSSALDRAPGFLDAAHGDYTLRPGAFAREKGVKLGWMTDSSLDFAGNPRLVNRDGVAYAPDALPDLGCYEAQVPAPGFLLLMR